MPKGLRINAAGRNDSKTLYIIVEYCISVKFAQIPAIESSHAVAFAMRMAKQMKTGSILINLSGRGDKDMDFVLEHYGLR